MSRYCFLVRTTLESPSPTKTSIVKDELAATFKGVTAYFRTPAEGVWKPGKQSDTDEIVIFEVMTDEVDLPDWQRRRAELERRFRQDEIIIRYLPMALV